MLNDDFVVKQAEHLPRAFARGLSTTDAASQIELAFRIALARSPSSRGVVLEPAVAR